MKENVLVVSRNSFSAITRDSELIDTLKEYNLFCVYSPRAHVLPPKELCRELHLIELRDSEEYIAGLSSLINSRYPISRVVSVSEQDLLPAAAARDKLQLPGMSRAMGELFRDKVQMKGKVKEVLKVPAQLEVIEQEALRDFQRKYLKVIVKPKAGYGSQDCFVVDSDATLNNVLQQLDGKLKGYFAEQFIDLPIYHFDSLVRDGRILFSSLGSYNHPPLDFEKSEWLVSTISNERTPMYLAGIAMLEKLIERFGVADGVFHLEFFADEKEAYFGEVAIRPAGGGIVDAIYRAWGIHLYEEHVRLQLGLPPKVLHTQYPEMCAANMLYYASRQGKLTRLDVAAVREHSLITDVHLHAYAGKTIDRARYSGDALFTAVIVADNNANLGAAIQSVMKNAIVEIQTN